MSRFIWPSVLIMTAAIVAIIMAWQPHVNAPGHTTGTKPSSTKTAAAHDVERPLVENSGTTEADSIDESRSPSPSSLSHAVPRRAASTPPDVPYLTPQPAAWIDLDLSQTTVGADFEERVIALAQDVIAQTTDLRVPKDASETTSVTAESMHPENVDVAPIPVPAASHPNWANAVAESDFRFRQLYGGRLWMEHHHQSHHLAAGNLPAEN